MINVTAKHNCKGFPNKTWHHENADCSALSSYYEIYGLLLKGNHKIQNHVNLRDHG